jgi:hypothetical protein
MAPGWHFFSNFRFRSCLVCSYSFWILYISMKENYRPYANRISQISMEVIWNIPYLYRIFYMSMEYPKWVWYSYRTFYTHIEYSIGVWNLWGVLVSADCSTGQNLAGKELLKIIWTYAYRIHTDMESSKKFHIPVAATVYKDFRTSTHAVLVPVLSRGKRKKSIL